MRLKRLTVEGFRAFVREEEFDLDANAVVVVGSNGQGKTSLFDAILWCLTGVVPRLGGENGESVVSRYSRTGRARVELVLGGENQSSGGDLLVRRVGDSDGQRVYFERKGESASGPFAEEQLIREVWRDASFTQDPKAALLKAVLRGVYLQQDRVRDFVEADSDSERFSAISELVGVGRVTELITALAKERKKWSEALNKAKQEEGVLADEIARLTARLESLGKPAEDRALEEDHWSSWWDELVARELAVEIPRIDSPRAGDALDAAVRAIDSARRREEREEDLAKGLAEIWDSGTLSDDPETPEQSLEELRKAQSEAEERLETAEASVRKAREQSSRELAELVSASDRRQQRAGMAKLALEFLSEECPVCGQEIDPDRVASQLQSLIAQAEVHTRIDTSAVDDAAEEKAKRENELDSIQEKMEGLERARRNREQKRHEVYRDLARLGIEVEEDVALEILRLRLDRKLTAITAQLRKLSELKDQGEELALAHARRAEETERHQIEKKLQALEERHARQQGDIDARDRTTDMANRMLDGLQDAEINIVKDCIKQLAPLLQKVYSRVDIHPSFRDVELIASTYYGKGRLNPVVFDARSDGSSEDPALVLSSSQVNVLALAIFVSINLGLATLPLKSVLLDDPIQSLDDVNLLGLTDLLRRTKDVRQIVVSTHDPIFGRLLTRKLRPVESSDRTVAIILEGWGRNGPHVRQTDVEQDTKGLRIVA